MAGASLHLHGKGCCVPAEPHGAYAEGVHCVAELLFERVHGIDGEEEGLLRQGSHSIEGGPDPNPEDHGRAGLPSRKGNRLNDELHNIPRPGGEEHPNPGDIFGSGALGEDRDGEFIPGPDMDCGDPRAGIVTGILPGAGVDGIRPEGDLSGGNPYPPGHGIFESPGIGNIGRQGDVDDRDAGILADEGPALPGKRDVCEDILELSAGYRVPLPPKCRLYRPFHVIGEPDLSLCEGIRRSIRDSREEDRIIGMAHYKGIGYSGE